MFAFVKKRYFYHININQFNMKKYFTLQNIGMVLLVFGVSMQVFDAIAKTEVSEKWANGSEIIWPIGLLIWSFGEMRKEKKKKKKKKKGR